MEVRDIPTLNAALNATATVLLLVGFILIRRGDRVRHRACMTAAFAISCLFLIGYVAHKILVNFEHTPIGATGFVRTFYYVMLLTHVVLAMVIVPLVLVTFRFALRGAFDRHRAWARWTFPLWFYVSVTGVLVYFFLYVWFPSAPAAS